MSAPLLDAWSQVARPVIGVVHAPPLPGSPRFAGDFEQVRRNVLVDADALVAGGVHGLILENYGDAPFFAGRVPACVVAAMTALAIAIRQRVDAPLGVNVLRNDGRAALAVALAAGAAFIRVNVLCGARVTDQGVLEGIAHDLQRDRAQLGAGHVRVLADVDVKHSAPLGAPRPIEVEVRDTVERGLADAVIVSGGATGAEADVEQVRRAKSAAGDAPVLVGSGVTADNVARYLDAADGIIVGTALKRDGITTNPVDPKRVQALVGAATRG